MSAGRRLFETSGNQVPVESCVRMKPTLFIDERFTDSLDRLCIYRWSLRYCSARSEFEVCCST